MGVVEDLTKQYDRQIDDLRMDNAALYGQLAERATEAAILRQENQQLRAANRKDLPRLCERQMLYLQRDNLALHRPLGESAAAGQ